MSRSFKIFTYLDGRNGSEASHVSPDDSEVVEAAGLLEDHGALARPTYDSCADVSHCFPMAGELMGCRRLTEDICLLVIVKIDPAVGNLVGSARVGLLEDCASGNYYCDGSPKCGLPTISLNAVIVYEAQEQGTQRARRSRCFANSSYCRYMLNVLLVYVVSRHHYQGEIIFTAFF